MRNPLNIKSGTGLIGAAMLVLILAGCDAGNAPLSSQPLANGAILAAETNGRFTLVTSGNGPVQVWRQGDATPLYQWYQGEETDPVLLLTISPGGNAAATATSHTVAVWSLESGQNLGFYSLPQSLRALALANNGQALLLGYQNGTVEFVNLNTGRRLQYFGHENVINSLDLSANGRYALSASHDGMVHFWQTTDAALLASWQHSNSANLVKLDENGSYAFSADAQGNGKIHHLPGGELQAQLKVPARGQTFVSARLNAGQNLLATGGTSRRLDLWQLDSGTHLQQWQVGLHTQLRPASAMVYSVAFVSPDTLYSASSSGLAETWTITNSEQNDE